MQIALEAMSRGKPFFESLMSTLQDSAQEMKPASRLLIQIEIKPVSNSHKPNSLNA